MVRATPERVLRLYEEALEGCANGRSEDVNRALLALIDALDFEEGAEVAEAFYRLYGYCIDRALEQDFDRVAWVLSGLSEAWADSTAADRLAG